MQLTAHPEDNPGDASSVEIQGLGLGAGHDAQIRPPEHAPQECFRGIPAHALPLVDLEIARPLVGSAVEILGPGNAEFFGSIAEGIQDWPGQALALDAPFATGTMKVVGATKMVLGLAEIWKYVVPAPTKISGLPPAIIVGRLAAHIDHAVDRRAAAQKLAARIVERTTVQPGLRLGLHQPIGTRVAHAIEIADGNVDPVVAVTSASLQKQHAHAWVGRQSVGQHAAG